MTNINNIATDFSIIVRFFEIVIKNPFLFTITIDARYNNGVFSRINYNDALLVKVNEHFNELGLVVSIMVFHSCIIILVKKHDGKIVRLELSKYQSLSKSNSENFQQLRK